MKLLKIISNFFKPQAYGNNTVIMLIGLENTLLTAYSTKGFNRTIHIANTDPEFFGKYRSFLNQFKNWDVILLLDNENVKISKGEVPVLQSIIKTKDNAKNFVLSSVSESEIVAYSKCKIETDSGVYVEQITFAHTKPSAQLIDIISFIYNFKFPLVGIYILTMEMQEIIENMCDKLDLSIDDKFIIFVLPTLVSGIRIFVLDRTKIYTSKVVPYPHGKSQEYIAGVIEQAVSDVISKYKKHIATHKLPIEVISLTSDACSKTLTQSEIDININALSWGDSKKKLTFSDFGDEVLVHNLKLKYPAANQSLRRVYAMEKFNNRVLNVAAALIFGMFLYVCGLGYKILSTEINLRKLNTEYYQISESYRDARKKLENINNLPDIYDIISDIAILKTPVPEPVEIIKNAIAIQDKRVSSVSGAMWKLTKDNIGSMESELTMNISYDDKSMQISELKQQIVEYQTSFTKTFPHYKIEYIDNQQNPVKLPNKVTIPIKFIIKGPVGLVE